MARSAVPAGLLVVVLVVAMTAAAWLVLGALAPTEHGPAARTLRGVDAAADGTPLRAPQATWTLLGHVTSLHGRPLRGVRVDVDGRRVESGPDGGFEVRDLPWRDHDVAFWLEGHELLTRHVAPGEHPSVRMRPLSEVRGVVRLPGGEPLGQHRVVLRMHDGTERESTTDDDGAFVFERVPSGTVTVRATAHVDARGAFQTTYRSVAVGGGEPVVIVADPGAAFFGTVTDPQGAPVEGAVCRIQMYRGGATRSGAATTSDAEGRFALVVPPEQACSIIVETPVEGEGWRWLRWFRHELRPEDGHVEVVLEEGHEIAGRVAAPRGVAVAGRGIHAWRIVGTGRNLITGGTVRDDGTFRIGGLWEADYELRLEGAYGANDPYVLSDGYRVKSGTTDLVLALSVPRPFRGRVLGKDGAVVANRGLLIKQDDVGFSARLGTDADGRFELLRPPPGTLRVLVYRLGRNQGVVDGGTWPQAGRDADIRLGE